MFKNIGEKFKFGLLLFAALVYFFRAFVDLR